MATMRRCISLLVNNHVRIKTFQSRNVHRWVAPTLMAFKAKENKLGGKVTHPRNTFLEWNLEAELFAFGKRLNEEFDSELLLQAFTDRSYVIKEELKQKEIGFDLKLKDNKELAERGEKFMSQYIQSYLEAALPRFPSEGIASLHKYLMSEAVLSHVSSHLGTKDIILADNYPVEPQVLATTLKAIIGALLSSSGDIQTTYFVRDFVITQLQGKDVNSFWHIEDPWGMLQSFLEKTQKTVEPRLIGEVGANTLLACYRVGLYVDKQMLCAGFGEDVPTAKEMAAREALKIIFGTTESMYPMNFKLEGMPKSQSEQNQISI